MNGPILYVENDDNDIFLLQRALKRIGFPHRFLSVWNGREGLDYLNGAGPYADRQEYPLPSLLVLDLKMPELSGTDVLRSVRTQPRFQALPILLLSSSTQPSDIEDARQHGANAFAVKPGTPQELEAVLVAIRDEVFALNLETTRWPVRFNQFASLPTLSDR